MFKSAKETRVAKNRKNERDPYPFVTSKYNCCSVGSTPLKWALSPWTWKEYFCGQARVTAVAPPTSPAPSYLGTNFRNKSKSTHHSLTCLHEMDGRSSSRSRHLSHSSRKVEALVRSPLLPSSSCFSPALCSSLVSPEIIPLFFSAVRSPPTPEVLYVRLCLHF